MNLSAMFPALVLGALFLTGCGPPKAQLNVFIWSEYLDPQVVQEFERRFQCRVNLDYYEDPESMVAKLSAGGASSYDIVVPADNHLPVLVQRGLLAPLRPENLPNLKHIAPEFRELRANPRLRYGVPYLWGCVGLYVRPANGQPVEDTWAVVFDPKRAPGSFLLMDDLRATLGAALRYQGHSLNSGSPEELKAARDLLIDTKKRSLGFEGGVGCKNRVLARGAAVAMAYNGDASAGAREDAETRFFVPREGSQIYVDFLSIPSQAPHRDLAEAFINFILEPAISARLANFTRAPTPNQAALPLIDPTDRRNPAIYPPPEIMARLEYAHDLGETNRLYDEIWTQVKAR